MNIKFGIKRILLVICLFLLGFILASITAIVIIYKDEIKTLSNLEKIDEYGMYQMTYYGDYALDELLKTGVNNDIDIGRFVTSNMLSGIPIPGVAESINKILSKVGGGCTAFVTENNKGEILYGRNYDYIYSPSLVLKTNPENGYNSVSTVNLSILGFSINNLPENLKEVKPSRFQNIMVLLAPYIPFDGMNEKGVAISMMSVPEASAPVNPEHLTLNPTVAIRLVLDKASSVDEAISLLGKYNIYFSGNVPCHFLIADSTGNSVIVEYLDNEMKVIKGDGNYQAAANYIVYENRNVGAGQDRVAVIEEKLKNCNYKINDTDAIELLAKTGVFSYGNDSLQWSVLYNLTNKCSEIFAHRKMKDRTYFCLE